MAEEERFLPSSFSSHEEELSYLELIGFSTNPLNKIAKSLQEIWDYSQEMEKKKDDLQYQIDGMVVKLDDNKLAEKLGVVGKTPRGWCAVKFKADEAVTRILDITWQVGRTGKLTPVAELEEVLLNGTKVKRATLHNFKEVKEREIRKNDYVVIRKAGDIIPEVVKVMESLREEKSDIFQPIDSCPSCQTKLTTSSTDVDLICPNQENCHDQILLRLSYFSKRNIANIVGLSEKITERFMEEYEIKDIPDLYKLPWEKIFELERFGNKSVENLKESIDNSKNIEDYKFLAGIGIEGVGPEVAKLICTKLKKKQKEDG
jgi:DNA ligase (NAD+)